VNEVEPLTLNIGGTGEVNHYFRGISEITPKEGGVYKLDVTLQFLSDTV
jgi:hypothetical protein